MPMISQKFGRAPFTSPMATDIRARRQQELQEQQWNRATAMQKLQQEQYEARKTDLETNYVKLGDGSYITKTDYEKLEQDDLAHGTHYAELALQQGLDALNDTIRQEFESTHVQLGTGEWIEKSAYDELDSTQQAKLSELGVEKYNQYTQEKYDAYMATLKRVQGGYVSKSWYDWLFGRDKEAATYLYQHGWDAFATRYPGWASTTTTYTKKLITISLVPSASADPTKHIQLKTGEWMWKSQYNALKNYDTQHGTNYHNIAYDKGVKVLKKALKDDGIDIFRTEEGEIEITQSDKAFKEQNIQMSNGDWINKKAWQELKQYDKENDTKFHNILYDKGYEAFKRSWSDKHIALSSGDTMLRTEWLELKKYDEENKTKYHNVAYSQGIEALNEKLKKEEEEFNAKYVEIVKDSRVYAERKDWENLSGAEKAEIMNSSGSYCIKGSACVLNIVPTDSAKSDYVKIDNHTVSREWFEKNLTDEQKKQVEETGTYDRTFGQAWYEAVEAGEIGGFDKPLSTEKLTEKYNLPVTSVNETIGIDATKVASTGQSAAKTIGIFAAEILVPGVYLARHWNTMSNLERAAFVGLDALFFLPIIAEAGKGARTVSIAGKSGGLIRVSTAGKFAAREAVRQVLWPVELVKSATSTLGVLVGARTAKIVESGKIVERIGSRAAFQQTRNIIEATAGRIKGSLSSIETLVRPTKLPESIVSDIFHTIKVPMSRFKSVEEGVTWRQKLIKAAAKSGNALVIEIEDSVITIKRSPLMRELGGGLSHATPDAKSFLNGTIVEYKTGLPLIEQGLFVSPEVALRFAEQSAFGFQGFIEGTGKVKAAVYIASPELASKAIVNTKIYGNLLEAEGKFKVGVKLPTPKQMLFTRMGDTGTKVQLLLAKRLTWKQVYKLKAEGLIEQIKNLYQPSITIARKDGKPLTEEQIMLLADIIEETDRGLAKNIRTIAQDPSALLRVYSRLTQPVVYRIIDVKRSNLIQTTITEVKRNPNETNRDYLSRIEKENKTGRIPSSELEDVYRQVREVDKINDRLIVATRKEPNRVEPTESRVVNKVSRILEPPRISEVPRVTRTPEASRTPDVPRAPRIPRTPKMPRTPKAGKVLLASSEEEQWVKVPLGSIAWKQGIVYKHIPPPWRQEKPITTKDPPKGFIMKGRTPAQTIQMIGKPKSRVPKSFSIDMGVTDIFVNDYGKKIVFRGRGLKTSVGKSRRSTTTGMSQGISVAG